MIAQCALRAIELIPLLVANSTAVGPGLRIEPSTEGSRLSRELIVDGDRPSTRDLRAGFG